MYNTVKCFHGGGTDRTFTLVSWTEAGSPNKITWVRDKLPAIGVAVRGHYLSPPRTTLGAAELCHSEAAGKLDIG